MTVSKYENLQIHFSGLDAQIRNQSIDMKEMSKLN